MSKDNIIQLITDNNTTVSDLKADFLVKLVALVDGDEYNDINVMDKIGVLEFAKAMLIDQLMNVTID